MNPGFFLVGSTFYIWGLHFLDGRSTLSLASCSHAQKGMPFAEIIRFLESRPLTCVRFRRSTNHHLYLPHFEPYKPGLVTLVTKPDKPRLLFTPEPAVPLPIILEISVSGNRWLSCLLGLVRCDILPFPVSRSHARRYQQWQ
jgi:hypothetical protein